MKSKTIGKILWAIAVILVLFGLYACRQKCIPGPCDLFNTNCLIVFIGIAVVIGVIGIVFWKKRK